MNSIRLKKILYLIVLGFAFWLLPAITHAISKECKNQRSSKQQDCFVKNDSAGHDYWEIKNETNHRTITIVSDKEVVEIEPGEIKKVYRKKNFNFFVGYPDRYGDKKNKQEFVINDHALSVYSRYFGKQGKLQFLIGITKKT